MLYDLGIDRGKLELLREVGRLDDIFLRQLSILHVLVVVAAVRLRTLRLVLH